MFAGFGDENGGYFSGSAVRDEVSYIEVPLFYGAFYGRIPRSEPELCSWLRWVITGGGVVAVVVAVVAVAVVVIGWSMFEGVAEETSTAFDLIWGDDLVF